MQKPKVDLKKIKTEDLEKELKTRGRIIKTTAELLIERIRKEHGNLGHFPLNPDSGGIYSVEVASSNNPDYGQVCGESIWRVYHFPIEDVYLRFEGWESSYNGTVFSDHCIEVKPITKTITFYNGI